MSTAPNTALPSDVWSEVRAHDHVTRYRRSGTGRAVVILDADDGVESLWPELTSQLAARFRVIVPEIPPPDVDLALWLGEFLEELGMLTVALLAGGSLCVPALELALRDPDQVARLIIVPGGTSGDSALGGSLATPPSRSVPLLLARRGLPVDEAIPLIERFLAEGGVHAAEVSTLG